jgi:hypothetical protein
MTEGTKTLTERDRQLRRREWLYLYLPMIVGALLVLALVAVIAIPGFGEANLGGDPASAWGDTGAVLVIAEALMIGMAPLILVVALCALFIWLMIKVQPLLKQGQDIAGLVQGKVDESADGLVARMVKPYRASARVCAFFDFFRRSNV